MGRCGRLLVLDKKIGCRCLLSYLTDGKKLGFLSVFIPALSIAQQGIGFRRVKGSKK